MSGREPDGVVEEEQRCPASRARQRKAPAAKLGETDDPQRTAVVAHDVLGVVDHATTIAGEQATAIDGVQITPRIDTVAARHDPSLSLDVDSPSGSRA